MFDTDKNGIIFVVLFPVMLLRFVVGSVYEDDPR